MGVRLDGRGQQQIAAQVDAGAVGGPGGRGGEAARGADGLDPRAAQPYVDGPAVGQPGAAQQQGGGLRGGAAGLSVIALLRCGPGGRWEAGSRATGSGVRA